MINKYKTGEYEFLVMGNDLPEANEITELLEENVKLEDNQLLPIYDQDNFERDKKLFRENITSYDDLKYAYFLIKTKELSKSASIRKLVIEKYESISEYFNE